MTILKIEETVLRKLFFGKPLACVQALLAGLGILFGQRKNESLCEAGGGGMGRRACTQAGKPSETSKIHT